MDVRQAEERQTVELLAMVHTWTVTIERVIFKAEIFTGEAKYNFQRIKILKITNFKEFSTEIAIYSS